MRPYLFAIAIMIYSTAALAVPDDVGLGPKTFVNELKQQCTSAYICSTNILPEIDERVITALYSKSDGTAPNVITFCKRSRLPTMDTRYP